MKNRYIVIALFFISINLYAEVIDKLYLFSNYSQTDKNKKNILSKVSIEKTFDYENDDFLFFNLIGDIDYNYNDKENKKNLTIEKLYYDRYFLNELFNLRVGRDTKRFDFTDISILNFLSPNDNIGNPDDILLNRKPMDGFSFTLNDIRENNINKYITFHYYIEDINNKEKRKNKRYLLEFTKSGDRYNRSIFIFNNEHYTALALANEQTVTDNFFYSTAIKYNTEYTLEGATKVSYSFSFDSTISAELIYFGDKLSSKDERIEKNKELAKKGDDAFSRYYKNLTSKHYLYLSNRSEVFDVDFYLGWLKNLTDSSNRYTIQVSYNIGRIKFYFIDTIFSGNKDSEFGWLENNLYNNKFNFLISYLYN